MAWVCVFIFQHSSLTKHFQVELFDQNAFIPSLQTFSIITAPCNPSLPLGIISYLGVSYECLSDPSTARGTVAISFDWSLQKFIVPIIYERSPFADQMAIKPQSSRSYCVHNPAAYLPWLRHMPLQSFCRIISNAIMSPTTHT